MAAITTTSTGQKSFELVRTGTAQATVGQTDWVAVPSWARYAKLYLNYTATAGTTPLVDLVILDPDPVAKSDAAADSVNLGGWDGITQVAGASAPVLVVIQIGPGVTGIADDDTAQYYSVNALLPHIMGFKLTLDRTTGDETYTYTLSVVFSK